MTTRDRPVGGEMMASEGYERFSRQVWQIRSEALYYHRLAGAVGRRWQVWGTISALLAALTSSTSAIAGWTLWEQPGAKQAWAVIAGLAALIAIVNGVLEVTRRAKDREALRSSFRTIVFDAEDLLDSLLHGIELRDARTAYETLKRNHQECVDRLEGLGWDPVETNGLQKTLREDVRLFLLQEQRELPAKATVGCEDAMSSASSSYDESSK